MADRAHLEERRLCPDLKPLLSLNFELQLIIRTFFLDKFLCMAGATGVLIVCYFIPILNHYLMWFGRSVLSICKSAWRGCSPTSVCESLIMHQDLGSEVFLETSIFTQGAVSSCRQKPILFSVF